MKFSSKAKTLEALYGVLEHSLVLPVYSFFVKEYEAGPSAILDQVRTRLLSDAVVVRSSAKNEDNQLTSNAGHFLSVLNVEVDSDQKLSKAIEDVISSFDGDGSDEVFVQPMLLDIAISGVVFTADIDTSSPYYIINYDETGDSSAVTSGSDGQFKTFIHLKGALIDSQHHEMRRLIEGVKEIEDLFDNDKLDIEFAITEKGDIYIFQVRPIVTVNKEQLGNIELKESLNKVHKKIKKLGSPHPNLLGSRTIFGVMPDWNPAEILGLKPKPLALSLYKELITDSIWAFQRSNYGYRNMRSHPLLISFMGIPYVDVRVDFNSFVPNTLKTETARKLVEHYLDKLIEIPSYHDKVEFEIVHSCFYFNLREKLFALEQDGFSSGEVKEIEKSLLDLTNKVVHPVDGLYKQDIVKLEKLDKKYHEVVNSDLALIDKIYWLIEDCKRYGTLPFAGIARASFIATQVLRSIIDLGILSKEEYNNLLNSFTTITTEFKEDLKKYSLNQIDKCVFLKKYGHLRPGTYDILSKRYDEDFDSYFSELEIGEAQTNTFELSEDQRVKIKDELINSGLEVTVDELFQFFRETIEGREYSKYLFTRSLSEVLKLIETLGTKANLTREDMSFVDIKTILSLYSTIDHRDLSFVFGAEVEKNKNSFQYTKAVKLPSLILSAEDIYSFFLQDEEPSFVTLKSVKSKVLNEEDFDSEELEGAIICIQSADPGYDYLFSRKIGGLITQFGGANSHMAVRCAELGIPAVIGAGEKNFLHWSSANRIELNAESKSVKVIS